VRRGWQVLIPVKPLAVAKTRIDLDPQTRADLALAMCRDVVAATTNAPNVDRVQVISTDPRVAAAVRPLGADLWQAPPGVRGLNAELSAALTVVPDERGVAMLMADLPCLTSGLIAEILDTAPLNRASFVPDLAEQGTTMLVQPPGIHVTPRFGDQSANVHSAIATAMTGDGSWLGAHRDVDTLHDLEFAARLGAGRFTMSFLEMSAALTSRATSAGNRAEVWSRSG
jgi:2-phospho-L-lactate/phosphoenolpyruvate guanylyltransferase